MKRGTISGGGDRRQSAPGSLGAALLQPGASLPQPGGRTSLAAALPEDLPPGWVRKESRSKRGAYYYAHPATGRTQVEKPVEMNSRQKAFAKIIDKADRAPVPQSASASSAAGRAPDKGKEGEAMSLVMSEDDLKKKEQREVEAKKKIEMQKVEAEARKKRAEENAKKQAVQAAAEEAEQEEARQRAMQKRAMQAAAVKAHDEGDEDKEKSRLEEEAKVDAIRKQTMQKATNRAEKKKAWLEEEDSDEGDMKVTAEEVEKWKEDEEQRERDEIEAKKRAIEAEKQRIIDEKLAKEQAIRDAEEAKIRAKEEEEQRIVEEALEKARVIAEAEEARKRLKEEAEQREQEAKIERERVAAQYMEMARQQKEEDDRKKQEEAAERARNQARLQAEYAEAQRIRYVAAEIKQQEEAVEKLRREEEHREALRRQKENREEFERRKQEQILQNASTPSNWNGTLGSDAKRQRTESSWDAPAAPGVEAKGKDTGTIVWYNGRRRTGLVVADRDKRKMWIATGGAPNGGLAPPVPGGLMHGTRVSYMTAALGPGQEPVCYDVAPLEGQVGLSCGGDSLSGQRAANEDRTIAVDLPEGLGHMVGIFDGHRGTACAEYLAQNLSKSVTAKVQESFNQWLIAGRAVSSLSVAEEVGAISTGIVSAFEACDHDFLSAAANSNWGDGASALVAVVSHGYETEEIGRSTVLSALGGQAKLFAAHCGTSRMIVLRGRQAMRVTRDHVCSDAEERQRLESMGAMLLQDPRGIWVVGRPDRMDLARHRQQGYEEPNGPKPFLTASRGFGDLMIKQLPYRKLGVCIQAPVVTAEPELAVLDLCPADWACVLGGRGIYSVLSDQDVADVCLEMISTKSQGPVEAAKAVTRLAMQRGATDNLTCIVMRFGWTNPPPPKTLAQLLGP